MSVDLTASENLEQTGVVLARLLFRASSKCMTVILRPNLLCVEDESDSSAYGHMCRLNHRRSHLIEKEEDITVAMEEYAEPYRYHTSLQITSSYFHTDSFDQAVDWLRSCYLGPVVSLMSPEEVAREIDERIRNIRHLTYMREETICMIRYYYGMARRSGTGVKDSIYGVPNIFDKMIALHSARLYQFTGLSEQEMHERIISKQLVTRSVGDLHRLHVTNLVVF